MVEGTQKPEKIKELRPYISTKEFWASVQSGSAETLRDVEPSVLFEKVTDVVKGHLRRPRTDVQDASTGTDENELVNTMNALLQCVLQCKHDGTVALISADPELPSADMRPVAEGLDAKTFLQIDDDARDQFTIAVLDFMYSVYVNSKPFEKFVADKVERLAVKENSPRYELYKDKRWWNTTFTEVKSKKQNVSESASPRLSFPDFLELVGNNDTQRLRRYRPFDVVAMITHVLGDKTLMFGDLVAREDETTDNDLAKSWNELCLAYVPVGTGLAAPPTSIRHKFALRAKFLWNIYHAHDELDILFKSEIIYASQLNKSPAVSADTKSLHLDACRGIIDAISDVDRGWADELKNFLREHTGAQP